MIETYDLIVIGAGPAGKSAAELAAGFGRRTLIIEQHQPGGVVTTTGGAPTKTLREAALYLTGFRQEEVYGVRAAVSLDVALPIIGQRTEKVRSELQRVAAEQIAARGIAYVVGRCNLALTARGAIAGHGGRLKLIFRADNRKLLGVHSIGDIASELVGLGHLALHVGSTVEIFLTLALNTPTYNAAYHDAAADGLACLAEGMGYERRTTVV